MDPAPAAVTGGNAVIDNISATGEGSEQYSDVIGRGGPDVTAVSIIASDGTEVHASIAEGWFVAWWPGADGANPQDRTMKVTTPSGTTEHTADSLTGW